MAKISFEGGTRHMPAGSGYDRELLLDETEHLARRHGEATLEVERVAISVRLSEQGTVADCGQCSRHLAGLAFSLRGLDFCRRCTLTKLH